MSNEEAIRGVVELHSPVYDLGMWVCRTCYDRAPYARTAYPCTTVGLLQMHGVDVWVAPSPEGVSSDA